MNSNAQTTTASEIASSSINMADPENILASTTPNSKPRQQSAKKLSTYVYQDFANAEPATLNTGTCHERVPPQSLQSQKLPSKLAAMLSDPDLAAIITWMPHGRSWKILNRELFSTFALPRYFGHSNHASFVRIVNAWGFRRITKGPDRDSYYHELFLRGKPRLHERMKRLPTCHRKSPVEKDDKCPDFYELAKTSPLPEVSWSFQGNGAAGGVSAADNAAAVARANAMNQANAASYGNPMAPTSMGMGGMGMGGMGSNFYGNNGTSMTSAMDTYLSNSSKQSNDIPSLLKLLRQQGPSQQQQHHHHQQQQHQHHQQQQQQGSNMNQNLMQQFLRLQQQQRNSASPSLSTGNSTLGQLANAASFAQPPASTSSSSNNAMLNSLSSMTGGAAPHQQQRRLSNDKISVNDVIQLRSIERTNELLAQKLALMQQDTQMMKQNAGPDNASPNNAAQSMMTIKSEGMTASSPSGGSTASGTTSKEEMLLQMIRRENQRNGVSSLGSTTTNVPTKVEDGSGNMSNLNYFLKSLNGMQQ